MPDTGRLFNKVTLVTGASRGIGRAIAERFAREGAKVVVNYASLAQSGAQANAAQTDAAATVQHIREFGGEAIAHDADVSNKSQVDAMIEATLQKWGRLDIMVCNAGICPFAQFTEITEDLWDRVQDVNLKGAFLCSQAAARQMIRQGHGGRILFTSSISSVFGGEMQAHYCPTKGGVNQLMKSIAIALGKHGITSNAVLPGTVITDINRQQLEVENPSLKTYFEKRTPLGRLPEPKDIASAMLFFASEDAAMVSGSTLVVDGGMSVNLQ